MSTQSHVWENPELTGETKKKKKKGIGGLVEKIKDVRAHALEKIKEPLAAPHENVPGSTTNIPANVQPQQQEVHQEIPQEVSQDVPHDVARNLGAALLLPVQQGLSAESQKKSTLQSESAKPVTENIQPQQQEVPHEEVSQDVPHDIARNLGAVLFLPVQQALGKKGESFDTGSGGSAEPLKSTLPQATSLGHHLGTTGELRAEDDPQLKARSLENVFTTKGTQTPQSSNFQDFLHSSLGEARKLGERMGTTSPKGEKKLSLSQKPVFKSKYTPKTQLGFQFQKKSQEEEGKLAADFLKAHVSEARKIGERMGTTSPKGKFRFQTKGKVEQYEGKAAADFLRAHVGEARKIGERMGTTSPKGNIGSTASTYSPVIEGELAAEFLQVHVGEARKIGERMGTTSPKGKFRFQTKGKVEQYEGKAADFLRAHVGEARKIGERMGTTSPKGKSQFQTSKSKPQEAEGKLAADFLKAHVSEARKIGERKGTTSPHVHFKPKSEVEGKSAADFLKAHVAEARKIGERMGTTSPKEKYRYSSPSVTSSSLEIEGTKAAQFLRANLNEARKLGENKGTTSPNIGTKEGVVHPSGEKKGTTKPESLLFRHNQLKEEATRKKSISHKE